jgi:hypothetical protein
VNILSIEKARTELLNFLENSSARRLKLKSISEFFSLLLNQESSNLIESYLPEFIPKYIDYLKSYSPFGIKPEFSQAIISINERLINLNELNEFRDKLSLLNDQLKNEMQELQNILSGKEILQAAEQKILFPVINEDEQNDNRWILGSLDSLTIKISTAKDTDKFIVVPSEIEKDKKLEEQINISWLKAKEFCKKYVKKISAHHEVIISLDEHLGIYKGDSVGSALSVGFIEELLKFYNSQTILKPIGSVAFTGGVKENGDVTSVSKEIIKKKVEISFFSNCTTLALPKDDEQFALKKLDELRKEFPKRNLKIVGVKDLDEILLRRELVDIKKQKLVVRTGKFVKKNWMSAVATVLLAVLFGYVFVMDFDDNPALLTTDGSTLFVKNKNGNILWTKRNALTKEEIENSNYVNIRCRIIDIDEDGRNEVLMIGNDILDKENNSTQIGLICYDERGSVRWTYVFSDLVESEREFMKPYYGLSMIDTITYGNNKCLLLFSCNSNSYSSAVFKIDIKTGERLPGALWCSGHTVGAIIKDIDNDGIRDILAVGLDNGFEEIVIWTFDIDNLTSVRLSTKEYTIKGFPPAKLKSYIRLAKTDYDNYLGIRMSGIESGSFHDEINQKKYVFATTSSDPNKHAHLWIKLDYNLKDFDVIVDNQYRVIRDTLVAHGKLNQPYSDTEDYKEIFKSKILYWKDGKWVKREELD